MIRITQVAAIALALTAGGLSAHAAGTPSPNTRLAPRALRARAPARAPARANAPRRFGCLARIGTAVRGVAKVATGAALAVGSPCAAALGFAFAASAHPTSEIATLPLVVKVGLGGALSGMAAGGFAVGTQLARSGTGDLARSVMSQEGFRAFAQRRPFSIFAKIQHRLDLKAAPR